LQAGSARPATSLARPLSLLVEIGLVKRELPFGEDPLGILHAEPRRASTAQQA